MYQKVIFIYLFIYSGFGATHKIQPRISNGIQSERGQFPFYVYLEDGTMQNTIGCGGTLISDRWILSAAHCFVKIKRKIRGHFGLWKVMDIYESNRKIVDIYPEDFHPHPEFTEDLLENDLALLELKKPIEFNNFIQPVALPCKNDNKFFGNPVDVIAVGTGFQSSSIDFPDHLQWASLSTLSRFQCHQVFPFLKDRQSVFCVSNAVSKQSICIGDSGGGLITHDFELIGVASFIVPDHPCEEGMPQAFTRVNAYLDWILNTTKAKLC